MKGEQRGVVLLASMVLVLLLGWLGLSAMSNAIQQARMVNNQREALQVFEQAEVALQAGEASISATSGSGATAAYTIDYLGSSEGLLGVPEGVPAALYRVTASARQRRTEVVLESFFARPLDAAGPAARRIAWRQIR